MYRLVVLIALVLMPARAEAALTIQEALLRAKPAVALVVTEITATVTLACSGRISETSSSLRETGSGWFVSPGGWLITNAHVIAAAHDPSESVRSRLAERATPPGCRTTAITLSPSIAVLLPNGKRLPARVAKYSPPVAGEMSGQDLALLQLDIVDTPSLALADSSRAKLGDSLHIIGFPGVVLSHELLGASAKMEASITNGGISGFREDRAGQPVIQTDAPAEGGSSGGPAVNGEGRVLGVLTSVTQSTDETGEVVQGFNFVIPARTVAAFLQGTGVKPRADGRFDQAWESGLRQFFQGSYGAAATSFEAADRLLPGLPDVVRLLTETRDKIQHPPPRRPPWKLIALAITAGGVIAYGALFVARQQRTRYRIAATEVIRLLDGAQPPVILDVRDEAAYAKSPFRIPNSLHLTAQSLAAPAPDVLADRDRMVVAYCT